VLIISGAVPLLMFLAFLIAPLISPYGPNTQNTGLPFAGPSFSHFFGTDELGRDLFTRVLYGGALSCEIALGATAIAMVVGVLWGFGAAMRGKVFDEVLMRAADIVMAIPAILLALILIAGLGANELSLIVVIGLLLSPTTARIARSIAFTETSRDYYSAAIAYGAGWWRLILREIFPNARQPLVAMAVINAANAILLEASLSFLGLGIQPPQQSLGSLLQEGFQFLYNSVSYLLFPALIIVVLIWSLNVFADQLGFNSDRRAQ
jgi:peptide/nickel transport system permease protein